MATPIRPDLPQLPQLPHLRRNAVLVVIGLVVLLIIVFPALVRFTASWYWYKEIGFETILKSEIVTRTVLMVGAGLAAFALLYANVRIAQRRARPLPAVMDDMISIAPNLPPNVVRRLATIIAIFFSLLTGVTVSAAWLTVLRFMNGVPFGVTDPVLGHDIGFYAYTLPVLSGVMAFLMTLTVIATLMTGGVYLANGAIAFQGQLFRVSRAAGVHIAAMLAVFFILTAVQIWLVGIPNLLFASTGPFTGASFTDVNVHRIGMYAAALAALAAAGMVIFGIAQRKGVRFFAAAVGLYMGVSLVGRALIPALVQRLVVAPTELTKERPYLANHIDATRRAWGLDSVETRDVRGEVQLTLANIKANAATIENVRLWDREPLRQTLGQLQEIRTYYDFATIDDDRYVIDGRLRQVHLAARELNSASLPTRSFINEHLTFTHGMGVALAPVNQVTQEGLPVLFIKDLPPVSTVSLRLTRPQIYYGELTNSYAVVGTRQREFDHPSGDANIFANYTGKGGVRLNSIWRRGLLAWHFGSLKLLLSQDIRSDSSRILYHRNIMERAARALPFVRFDRDPYLVITDAGELKWLLDAYTTTAGYPYAQRLPDGTSYTLVDLRYCQRHEKPRVWKTPAPRYAIDRSQVQRPLHRCRFMPQRSDDRRNRAAGCEPAVPRPHGRGWRARTRRLPPASEATPSYPGKDTGCRPRTSSALPTLLRQRHRDPQAQALPGSRFDTQVATQRPHPLADAARAKPQQIQLVERVLAAEAISLSVVLHRQLQAAPSSARPRRARVSPARACRRCAGPRAQPEAPLCPVCLGSCTSPFSSPTKVTDTPHLQVLQAAVAVGHDRSGEGAHLVRRQHVVGRESGGQRDRVAAGPE